MASGKKNYFRHSFFARNDIKLKLLRDKIGVGYYFYFFTLLEQCGEASSDELQEIYTFHDSTIRSLWGVNLKKSERVANEMASVCLLEFKKVKNTFTFKIPNLSKYLGQYETKSPSNMSNKRKEKERKEKESEIEIPEIQKPKKKKPETNIINTGLFTGDKTTDLEELPTSDAARNVLTLMNTVLFTRFGATEKNLRFVNGRLSEGFKLEDFKKVFEVKRNEWDGTDMAKYLRPSTLLGTKFDEYLSQAENALKPKLDPLDEFFQKYAPSTEMGA